MKAELTHIAKTLEALERLIKYYPRDDVVNVLVRDLLNSSMDLLYSKINGLES